MDSTLIHVEEDASSPFEEILTDAAGDDIFAVGFAKEEPTVGLVKQLNGLDEPPTVRLLAADSVLKWFREDFLIASTAAELVADGTLALRSPSAPFENVLLVTEEQVFSIVHTDAQTACIGIDDAEFVQSVRERCTGAWEEAEEFSLRTPPRSRIHETLTEEFGPEVDADFQAILDVLGSTRNGEFDEVIAALLAAAKHHVQLFEIGKWGENIGLASRATFSRKKTMLEEVGLIDTEKIPLDVGRPRLRLVLDTERFSEPDTPPDTIVSVGQQRLSAEA